VLALVPWILTHPGVTVAELAERFEVSEIELEADLELLPMCGLPPYTADRLMDVSIVDGEVEIRLAEYFERPLRLTPAEGVALLTAGRSLLAVPGSDTAGPLAGALERLEEALGARGRLAVVVAGADEVERLQEAATDHEQVEIDYYSFARDEMTTRTIDPWRVFHAFGTWYVAAWCHAADGERLFRIDRVRALRPTGTRFPPPTPTGDDGPGLVYSPRDDDPRVTLWLGPEAAWVVESLPLESVRPLRGGAHRVVLAVSEPAWLERLLLALGPAARVEGPPELVEIGATAAARLSARYRRT
jgi:proteasome accessory factor C